MSEHVTAPNGLARLVLAAVVLASVSACASSNRPDGSTETGNPPVIDLTRIALVVSSDDVHLTGEPGAVMPGGIEVEAETLGSGDLRRGPVAQDGSFDLLVAGSADDTYALRAVAPANGVTSAPVFVYLGGAMLGSGDAGAPSCEDQEALIQERLAQLESQLELDCTSNSDCAFGPAPSACPSFACGGFIMGSSDRPAVDAVAAIERGLCASFETDGCLDGVAQPRCAPRGPLTCLDGQCVDCAEVACREDSCQACDTPSVEWYQTAAGTARDVYALTDCHTLSVTPADASPGCSSELPCLAADGASPYSAADVQNLIGDPQVQAALAEEALFGAVPPGGFLFYITVGTRRLILTGYACNGDDGCDEPPPAVAELRAVLEAIASDACVPTAQAAECSLAYDPGTGSGSTIVYYHHPQSGACRPIAYTGQGGNANRFDDLTSCQLSCPPPTSSAACPPDRAFTEDICLSCGVAGGCAETSPGCAKLCTGPADCADEGGVCSPRGLCEMSGCI